MSSVDAAYPDLRLVREHATTVALAGVFADQQFKVIVAGRPLGPDWDEVLSGVLFATGRVTASEFGALVAGELGGEFMPWLMDAWLLAQSAAAAAAINDSTRDALADAEDPAPVFDALAVSGARVYARTAVAVAANFGAHDAAVSAGARTKTWVSSGSPRHSSLSGQTVGIGETFGNGMKWPGDPAGGAGEVVNCRCSIRFNTEGA